VGFWKPVVTHLIAEANASSAGSPLVGPGTASDAVLLTGHAPVSGSRNLSFDAFATKPRHFRLHSAEVQRLRRTLCDLARAVQVCMNARPNSSDADEVKRGRRAAREVVRLCVAGALQARATATEPTEAESASAPRRVAEAPPGESAMIAALAAMGPHWVRVKLGPFLQRELLLSNFLPIRLRGTGLIEPPASFVSSRHVAADGSLIVPGGEDFAARNERIRAKAARRSLADADGFFADMAAAIDGDDGFSQSGGKSTGLHQAAAPSPIDGSASSPAPPSKAASTVAGGTAQQYVAVKACVSPTTPLFFIPEIDLSTGEPNDAAVNNAKQALPAPSCTTTQAATTAEYQALLRQVCATAAPEVWQPVLREIEAQRRAVQDDLLELDRRLAALRTLRNEIRSVIAEALGEVRERDRLLHLEVSRLRGDGNSSAAAAPPGASATSGHRGLPALEPPPAMPHHHSAAAVAAKRGCDASTTPQAGSISSAVGVSGRPVSAFDAYGAREAVTHAVAQQHVASGDAVIDIEHALAAEAEELSALAGTVPQFQELSRVVPHFG
jgi:hypothetical protein